jgi:hypothetical protein
MDISVFYLKKTVFGTTKKPFKIKYKTPENNYSGSGAPSRRHA